MEDLTPGSRPDRSEDGRNHWRHVHEVPSMDEDRGPRIKDRESVWRTNSLIHVKATVVISPMLSSDYPPGSLCRFLPEIRLTSEWCTARHRRSHTFPFLWQAFSPRSRTRSHCLLSFVLAYFRNKHADPTMADTPSPFATSTSRSTTKPDGESNDALTLARTRHTALRRRKRKATHSKICTRDHRRSERR